MNNNKNKPLKDRTIGDLWDDTKQFFDDLTDLRDGMDQEGTIANINNNKKMQGANAWLLMCSIMVASLGLDLNSPAVIIGAMLISPLMSPILGIGLGIGINDRRTLIVSLQHFGIAIAIALITSVIYFKLTPFGQITNEITSRTSPNLLDGLVAVFGGLAGVISITRMDKSNAIPGVAIATALMPPLCVAGFGLAKGEWNFFLNAFYLFFLNSFFIAITTYLIIRLLGFPYKQYLNDKERKRNRMYIIFFSLIILIPASLILYKTVKNQSEQQKLDTYLKEKIKNEYTMLDGWEFFDKNQNLDADTLKLVLSIHGTPLSKEDIQICDGELEILMNKPVKLLVYQSKEPPIEKMDKLESRFEFYEELQSQQNAQIEGLNKQIDSLVSMQLPEIYTEIEQLFPNIEEIAITENATKSNFDTIVDIPIVIVKWQARTSSIQRRKNNEKLSEFIRLRTKMDTLQLISY